MLFVLNIAIMATHPVAQTALAISVVEALGQAETWTEDQRALLNRLADQARQDPDCPDAEREEVADAMTRALFRLSLRQGAMRLSDRLGLSQLRRRWDGLYEQRSGLVHGATPLSDAQIGELAAESAAICGAVVLALVAPQGAALPPTADTTLPRQPLPQTPSRVLPKAVRSHATRQIAA